ncbi:MAG: PQQ-dependent sugar dehydrogenase [Novosphingobium sp.]
MFEAMMSLRSLSILSPLALVIASCGSPAIGDSPITTAEADETTALTIAEVARFDAPWAMAFIPDTPLALVTEKKGRLLLWQDGGEVREVAGVPHVDHGGQGGLGDVVLSPTFRDDGLIFLSWAEAGAGDTRGAAVGKARLVLDGAPRLEGLEVIWRQNPKVTGRGHYSHRLAFSPDGKSLYIASGDRQKMTPAQDPASDLGKIFRMAADGSSKVEQVSLGHRNILGLGFDAQGRLWDLEHGPAGGDELNLVKPGANYGWPVVSQGDHYNGTPIPRHETRPDFAAPAISWNPVIAPGGMIFYQGDLFRGWRGQAIIAGLVSQGLVRVAIDGERAREVARHDLQNRIRAIAEREDGSIWVLEDGDNARLLKLTPSPN